MKRKEKLLFGSLFVLVFVKTGKMSIAMRAACASKDMKEEENKTCKRDNLEGSELKEQHMLPDIGKDFVREITKKPDADEHDTPQIQDAYEDGSLKSSSELTVCSLELLEKDKSDQSLSNCKQQVPGSITTFSPGGESKGVEVKVMNMSILSPGRSDVVIPIPFHATTSKATLFTLKEGSKYQTIFHFTVSNNTVNGLYYTYMVWKAGIRVCNTKKMMGNFNPRQEPYTFELEEGTTPSGFFARGPFLVRSKFVDDEGTCYFDSTYYFDIRKDWGLTPTNKC